MCEGVRRAIVGLVCSLACSGRSLTILLGDSGNPCLERTVAVAVVLLVAIPTDNDSSGSAVNSVLYDGRLTARVLFTLDVAAYKCEYFPQIVAVSLLGHRYTEILYRRVLVTISARSHPLDLFTLQLLFV